ncbi:twin arginine-targeting protein translocase TatB [Chromatiales bacterium (ex Bugula neritina AB1)]|nr:twin arginine-targeting protein translocase TatB [Chromatiales bacterium (ex Bugula neritina AB1)]
MFDVGFQEIVLIGVISLIVIGPEKLPSVARSVGLWVGKMQRFVAGVKTDIQSELKTDELRNLLSSQEDQIRELKEMVNETRSDLERTAKSASESLAEGMDSAVEQVRDATEVARENNAKMQAIADAAGHEYGAEDKNEAPAPATGADQGSSKPA